MRKLIVLLLSIFTFSLQAQSESEVTSSPDTFLGLPFPVGVAVMIFLLFIGMIVLLLIAVMIDFGRVAYNQQKEIGKKPTGIIGLFGVFEGDLTTITSEYQDQVIHEYDGIQEYDNDMPPWWKVGFYITIVFGVGYMLVYHVFGTLPLQGQEYDNEIAEASVLYANVDQVYEKATDDKAILTASSEIFTKNCKTCHGANAEGLVGPNLTDKYWINGSTVNDIYATIKYGKTEKNMPSWKSNFSNEQIYGIASYILSLQGTNPANAKEPQGDEVK